MARLNALTPEITNVGGGSAIDNLGTIGFDRFHAKPFPTR